MIREDPDAPAAVPVLALPDQLAPDPGAILQPSMYCFIVKATSACPIRLLSAFQSIFASRPAVA